MKMVKDGITTSSGKGVRLVHDGVNVIEIIDGTDITFTSTKHTIEECVDMQAAFDKIATSGLIQQIKAEPEVYNVQ